MKEYSFAALNEYIPYLSNRCKFIFHFSFRTSLFVVKTQTANTHFLYIKSNLTRTFPMNVATRVRYFLCLRHLDGDLRYVVSIFSATPLKFYQSQTFLYFSILGTIDKILCGQFFLNSSGASRYARCINCLTSVSNS